MKYYSENLKKLYDSEEELKEAEQKNEVAIAEQKALKEERKEAAKKVEALFKDANDAYKKACDERNEFIKKYGSFHQTFSSIITPHRSLFDVIFDDFLD